MSHQVIDCPPDWLQFLSGFVSCPLKVASLWPSSKGLGQRLAGLPCLRNSQLVVELGPGLGGTTRALLQSMPAESQLLGIEIVEQFVDQLRTIRDPRLHVVRGCAHHLERLLQSAQLPRPDVVVSGIPFSAMSRAQGAHLMRAIHTVLPVGGTFVAYQVRKSVCDLAAEHFGPARQSLLLATFPPLRIFEWQKQATAARQGAQQPVRQST